MGAVTPDIDHDLMGRLVLRIESDAHRRGWDEPASIMLVYNHLLTDRWPIPGLGRTGSTRLGPYVALNMPRFPGIGQPSHDLYRLALNLAYAGDQFPVDVLLAHVRRSGFLGAGMCYELWGIHQTEEELAERGQRSLADTPGAYEGRDAMIVTVDGSLFHVHRVRGQKPRLHRGDDTYQGSVPESLRMIVAVIAETPRPDMVSQPHGWSGS